MVKMQAMLVVATCGNYFQPFDGVKEDMSLAFDVFRETHLDMITRPPFEDGALVSCCAVVTVSTSNCLLNHDNIQVVVMILCDTDFPNTVQTIGYHVQAEQQDLHASDGLS